MSLCNAQPYLHSITRLKTSLTSMNSQTLQRFVIVATNAHNTGRLVADGWYPTYNSDSTKSIVLITKTSTKHMRIHKCHVLQGNELIMQEKLYASNIDLTI